MSTSILVYESERQFVKCAPMALKDNLLRIRRDRGISQAALAKASGVSQQSISRLESGADLTSKHLPKLARVLQVGVDDLDPSYFIVVNLDWRNLLKTAIHESIQSGATLAEIRSALEEAVANDLLSSVSTGIDALSGEQAASAEEAAEKIGGTSRSGRLKGT